MCPRAERRWRDRSGFTLVEVMVAFAVMALILGVLYRSVVQTSAGASGFSARVGEEIIAQSLIAEFRDRRDLRDGSYAGNRDGRRWTLRASLMDLAPQLPKGLAARDDAGASPAAASGGAAAPADKPKPVWVAQRLVLQVATGAKPLRTEVVHLVRLPPPTRDEAR